MPYIKVNLRKFDEYSSIVKTARTKLTNINSDLNTEILSMGLEYAIFSSDIRRRMNNISNQLGIEKKSLNKMATHLSNAKSKYSKLDSSTVKGSNYNKTIGKFISKLGFVGTIASGMLNVGHADNGEKVAKTVVELLKGGKDVVKGLVDWSKASYNRDFYSKIQPGKAAYATGKFWKTAFGFNDVFKGKASTASSWTTKFSRNFNKRMDSQIGNYTKGGTTSALAWLGVGLNLAGNAISNYEEAKEEGISAGRAVAETITETLVDTATGWVVGAAVAAGLAATIGSAPVLVVGAATVGITMGLDYACKKITGALTGQEKGLTETISDAVLDVGTAVAKGTKKIVSSIGKSIGKLFKKK